MPFVIFVDGDIDALKSYEIECPLNKQIIRKSKHHIVEYLAS